MRKKAVILQLTLTHSTIVFFLLFTDVRSLVKQRSNVTTVSQSISIVFYSLGTNFNVLRTD